MANKAYQLFRVLGLVCHVVDGRALSLVSDARHMVGYDVVKPFEHVDGSACCLDFSVDAAELDSCKRICFESDGCGSFLFTSADRQCYLISQESNFEPVSSPSGCERRCVEQEACEAFVFQSSSHLCFLVRFDGSDATETILTASVRPASDRIFGLVRDGAEGSIQAAISRSLLRAGNQSTAAELPSESLAAKDIVPVDAAASRGDTYASILGSAMAGASLASFVALLALLVKAGCASPRPRLLEVDVPQISSNPSLPDTEVSTPVVTAEATPQRRHTASIPVLIRATTPPRDASAALVAQVTSDTPQARVSSPAASKDASLAVAEVGHGAIAPSVPPAPSDSCASVTEIVQGISPPKATYKWRVREMASVPVERRVSVAGPTNYPVAGEASPFARSTPQKVLIRELVEDTGDPGEAVGAEAAEKPVQEVSESKSIWVPEVVLMARLVLGVFLLGVLTLDLKTIGTIAFALLCLSSMWPAAKTHRSNSESCFEDVVVGRTDAGCQSDHMQVLEGRNEESKQESQSPRLKRHLPPELQVMQGGG